jgi:hypothetical protein
MKQIGTVKILDLFNMLDAQYLTYYMRQGLKFYFSHNHGLEYYGGYLNIEYPKNYSINLAEFILEPLKNFNRQRFFFK